jgi:hypothetical protein
MFDFNLFYQAAQAILHGLSPYTVQGFYSPYLLAVLFVPFSLLPVSLAYGVFIVINLVLFFKVCHLKGLWALFSFPVIFCLFVGQIDLSLALLLSLGSPWLLPLAIVKPQIAWLTLPWLVARLDKKGFLKACGVGVASVSLCFLMRPTWFSEWLAVEPSLQFYSGHASSIYWLVPLSGDNLRVLLTIGLSILVFPVGFFLKKKSDSWTLLQLFQPLTNVYSASVLAEWIGPFEFVLSWVVVFAVGGDVHNGMPLFVIPLAILFREHLLPKLWPNRESVNVKLRSIFEKATKR